MLICPQCHANFDPEDLDSQNPTCPVCDEALTPPESESQPHSEDTPKKKKKTSATKPKTKETEEQDPLKTAPKIDGFEIMRHIGRGGMGDVWEARQNVLGRKVAIKVLAQNLSHSEHFLARFTREAFTLGRLQHPGIVSIYDFRSSPDGLCCIIMEYVEGPNREPTTLYDLIVSRELTPDRTRFLILQVLHSLQYAHEEGVIHRDIKPTNVLIDRYGRVKVVDFGIAAMPADTSRKQLTYVGGPLGTAEYMAPEQTEDATQADHRADLYAVGVVIYEMLTGHRPRGAFAPPSLVRASIDSAWDQVVNRALQPNRNDRYADAHEMIAEIQAIRGGNFQSDSAAIGAIPISGSENPFGSPIQELPFDEEPEEFPGGKTPLPLNTPTADFEPAAPSTIQVDPPPKKPRDTDMLPDGDEEQEIPSWMVKRRASVDELDDTQANLTEADSQDGSESVLEDPTPGAMDSTMRLDRRELKAESDLEIPIADISDLEDWLAGGPAPNSQDSSHMIEIAAHLAPTSDEPSEQSQQISDSDSDSVAVAEADPDSSLKEDTSDVVPISEAASNQQSPEEEEVVFSSTGTSGVLTTEDSAKAEKAKKQDSPAKKTKKPKQEKPDKLPPFEEIPEGMEAVLFVEGEEDSASLKERVRNDKAILFRPAKRPPTIKICVLDDASNREGEWYRIRQPSFVIGRNEGDIILGYDRAVSSRHAEIAMQDAATGGVEFVIRDLGSTNGTFARASRAILQDGQEFLLGYRRYKLMCNCQDAPNQPVYDKLMEVNVKGPGKAFRLGRPPVVIGRDPTQCNLLILDDPFLSPVHAVMKRDQKNRWVIKNYNSRNGIWIQIQEMRLATGGEFQIGSQRFIVKVP